MKRRDYIPRTDADFLTWATILIRTLGTVLERFGFPEELHAQLKQLLDDFATNSELASAPYTRTSLIVKAKNNARDTLKKAIRQAVREYLAHNHRLTGGDRIMLGLPIYKTSRRHKASHR
jgi:hypothetical protein